MKIPELTWPARQNAYDDDLLTEIRAGTVTLLVRGRNAWNSTWVRHYLQNATLYTDTPSAKLGAEDRRGPGNVFYVVDAPAVLLSGPRSKVVLCDAHPDNPFGKFAGFNVTVTAGTRGTWVDGLFPGISVRDAAGLFRHDSGHWSGSRPSEHSLRTGRLESADSFQTEARSMQSLVSRPVGSNYYLQWDPQVGGNRYSRSGAEAVVQQWRQLLADAFGSPQSGPADAVALRRHRDEALRALPKSQWLERRDREAREARERKQVAFERWREASDRASELEDRAWQADAELQSAREARMEPATTSAGVRAQRERCEAAAAELERLTGALAHAEAEIERLWEACADD